MTPLSPPHRDADPGRRPHADREVELELELDVDRDVEFEIDVYVEVDREVDGMRCGLLARWRTT
ncbi:MAG: hypothetical protein ABMB14_06730, partial [Myxococcota bacterium]